MANGTAAPLNHEVPPPPTYEVTLLNGEAAAAAAQQSTENEAPPPYSLVDPTKVHQASIEVIDLEDQSPAITTWLVSGSNMDLGNDCTFFIAFIVAFFFNCLGFIAMVCLIPNIAARFGAMAGFGLSVVQWITMVRYYQYDHRSHLDTHAFTGEHHPSVYEPSQTFIFIFLLFAGFFLFFRGTISYFSAKSRAETQQRTVTVFRWF